MLAGYNILALSFAFQTPLLGPHRHHLPVVRSGKCFASTSRCCAWEEVDCSVSARVMHRYFGAKVRNGQSCEIFMIEGVPAAAMLYTHKKHGVPVVDSFAINKGLMLMFDAGPSMRCKLYRKYRRLGIQHAKHRQDFLML